MPRRSIAVLTLALLVTVAPPTWARTTRAGTAATTVVSGLTEPTALAILPDARLVILEKGGTLRLWTPSAGLLAPPILRLPTCTDSEMGLLGVVADPGFTTNGFLYLYVTTPPGGDASRCFEGSAAGRRNRVVRVTLAGDAIDPASLVVVLDGLRTDGGNHDGGGLRIGPDGFLYVGVGDTGAGDGGPPGASTNPYARDLASREGKILRLTLDGSPAPGNPFLGTGGAADLVYAYGLRNPFRFDFDPQTERLWVGDVGQVTFEEIDVVAAGDDLGWPRCEGREPADACPGNTVPPVYLYGHGGDSASVTGGTFDAAGNYVFADFVFDLIWRLPLTAERTDVIGPPDVLVRNAGAPVDFQRGPDGAVWYVAFTAGEVVRLDAAGPTTPACAAARGRIAAVTTKRAGRRGGVAKVPRRLQRRLVRACGSDEAIADATATLAAALVERAGPPGRCARAVARGMVRAAADRLVSGVACDGGACPSAAALRRIGGACRTPPASTCAAVGCESCASADDLAACGGAVAAGEADAVARVLFGG
jgi:glucose/arabinose dehydrogenase